MNNLRFCGKPWFTLPNLFTEFRFLAAPALLWLAWHGQGVNFMVLLALVFLSDLLDGFAARIMGQSTPFGAMLDSWADLITYMTIAISCWWLWPAMVIQELVYVVSVIASCLLPVIAAVAKFRRFTSYHTWAVKIAAASMGLSLYVMFLGGPVWPFRLAAVICIFAAAEEIIITFLLPVPESDLRSVWHVLRLMAANKK